jgi:outer membrane lipoprotein-sorting protein
MRLTSRSILIASAIATVIAPACSLPAQAPQTADDLIARYLKTVGGMDKIQAVSSLRRVGKYNGSGGFEATFVQENKRPGFVREEFTFQGMTAVNAWDGKTGWKIDPFGGKRDAESLSEDEMRGILLDADFDEPLVNYREKDNKVEIAGMDQVEGTDVYKLKVTLKNGDIRTYYLDTDYYVPIKIVDKRTIRGSDQEIETTLGDYKEVAGWFMPFSIETGRKGQQNRDKFTWERIEPNVTLDDSRFHKPEIK